MTVLEVLQGTHKNRIFKQLSEPGIVEATIPAWMLHLTLCMATLKIVPLHRTTPSFSFSVDGRISSRSFCSLSSDYPMLAWHGSDGSCSYRSWRWFAASLHPTSTRCTRPTFGASIAWVRHTLLLGAPARQ